MLCSFWPDKVTSNEAVGAEKKLNVLGYIPASIASAAVSEQYGSSSMGLLIISGLSFVPG